MWTKQLIDGMIGTEKREAGARSGATRGWGVVSGEVLSVNSTMESVVIAAIMNALDR